MGSGVRMGVRRQFAVSNGNGPYYFRAYINVATFPSAANTIIELLNTTQAMKVKISLNSNGTLQLKDEDGDIGSPSAAITSNNFEHKIEIFVDKTGAGGVHVVTARLNETTFATASNRNLSSGIAVWRVGGNLSVEAQTQGDWYFDDIAVNDTTGGSQNSWCGSGKVIALYPNAAGDANAWLDTSLGAGTTNNYTLVDEIPPNNTDYVQSGVLNSVDMYNVSPSGIGSADTVSLVALDTRFSNLVADATAAFKVRLEKTASGTISSSADIIPNTTTWTTNNASAISLSPLVKYVDPDGAPFTQLTLDSIQIGVIASVLNANLCRVSSLLATVEYIPSPSGISKMNGVPLGSVAKINGVAIASVKKYHGITNI